MGELVRFPAHVDAPKALEPTTREINRMIAETADLMTAMSAADVAEIRDLVRIRSRYGRKASS